MSIASATPALTMYVDFDSCYYSVARRLYHVRPWTVITNSCNHMISVPHWLEGHFGAKKITYLVPPVKAKIKVKGLVRVFNVDEELPGGSTPRVIIKETVEREISKVKELIPSATLIHKDSIVAEYVGKPAKEKLTTLPYTIGIGSSEERAKADCAKKKLKKKSRFMNQVLLGLFLLPMAVDYLIFKNSRKGGQENEDH